MGYVSGIQLGVGRQASGSWTGITPLVKDRSVHKIK